MKKALLTTIACLCLINVFAQEKTFNSTHTNSLNSEYITKDIDRTITINGNTIRISNFLNGGIEELKLTVDKKEKKEYSWEGDCDWYYFHKENEKDAATRYIIEHVDNALRKEVNVFTIKNEVFFYHSIIALN